MVPTLRRGQQQTITPPGVAPKNMSKEGGACSHQSLPGPPAKHQDMLSVCPAIPSIWKTLSVPSVFMS